MRGVAAPWCQTCRSLDGALVSTWTSPVSALRLRPCLAALPCGPAFSRSLLPPLVHPPTYRRKTLRRTSHAHSAAPHPSRIPRMELRISCMRVFSSCPRPPHSASSLDCGLIIEKTIPTNHFSGQAHALTAAWREQNDFLYLLRTGPITCRSHQFLLSPRRCATRAARPSVRMTTKRITSNC